MLIFARFVQVDKSNAKFLRDILLLIIYFVILHCQTETEASTAGEQLARDMFDKTDKKVKKKVLSAMDNPF